jgi:hypothetical protein
MICPYCAEPIEIYVDPGGGEHQDYIEDCSVCCRPIRFISTWQDEAGEYAVEALAED